MESKDLEVLELDSCEYIIQEKDSKTQRDFTVLLVNSTFYQ